MKKIALMAGILVMAMPSGLLAEGAGQAMEGVSLEVEPGEILGLVGPFGCGKSTLLRTLSGPLEPSGGDLSALSDAELAARLEAVNGELDRCKRAKAAARSCGGPSAEEALALKKCYQRLNPELTAIKAELLKRLGGAVDQAHRGRLDGLKREVQATQGRINEGRDRMNKAQRGG